RPAPVLGQLVVLGEDDPRAARGRELHRLLHRRGAEAQEARADGGDARDREGGGRRVAAVLVGRAVVRPPAAVPRHRRRLATSWCQAPLVPGAWCLTSVLLYRHQSYRHAGLTASRLTKPSCFPDYRAGSARVELSAAF